MSFLENGHMEVQLTNIDPVDIDVEIMIFAFAGININYYFSLFSPQSGLLNGFVLLYNKTLIYL